MFHYDKKLQYPVKIDKPNPRLAAIIISQYGGPDGELGASLRYLSQRYSMPFDELKGLLTDIGTEGPLWHPLEKPLRCNVFIRQFMANSEVKDCILTRFFIFLSCFVVFKSKMPDLRNVI